MTKLKEFTPLEGETIVAQVEGDAYNDSPNPIMQIFMAFVKIIWMILGVKRMTYLVITNLRIVEVTKKTILWGILPGDTSVITLNKRSIQSVGYEMATSWFIFKKFYFVLANMSGATRITYKGNEKKLIETCVLVDQVVSGESM